MAEEETHRRSKREKKKSKASSALEKIRLSRESGVRQEDELEKTDGIFEYVTDEEYSKLVQERQSDQWIANDDGTYREHGRELFDEEVNTLSSGTHNGARPLKKNPSERPKKNIKDMVLGMGSGIKKRQKQNQSYSVKNDTALTSILEHIKHNKVDRQKKSDETVFAKDRVALYQRAPSLLFKKGPRIKTGSASTRSFNDLDPVKLWGDDDSTMEISIDDKQREPIPAVSLEEPSIVPPNNNNHLIKEENDIDALCDDFMEVDNVIMNDPVPEEAVSTSGWETVRVELADKAPPIVDYEINGNNLPLKDGPQGDKMMEFYWIDMYEDQFKQPGTVYIFGKVWIEKANSFVSCCVTVKNIERCMYFLPRVKMLSKSGNTTDEDVTMQDVYTEFNNRYAEKFRLMKFSSKRVERKYAFDLPDVPRQSEYFEVQYSADYPAPPSDAFGRSFSKIFGTNTSSLERLILNCRLKGPCWLNITNPAPSTQNISWCKIECTADSLSSVVMATEQSPPPPMTILSLSMKTILNTNSKANEVLCMGALVHKDVFLDKPPSTPFQSDICAIRKLHDMHFPLNFQGHMEKKNIRVEISANERGLLAFFLAKLAKVDPDIIIGHNLSSQWLDVLQHRMNACKVPSWSRIGRLKRQIMPKGKGSAQYLCCGRLVLDVKISAKELIRCRSYDLSELVNTVLLDKYQPWDEEKVLGSFGSLDSLSKLITHTMDEAFYSLKLTHELCVLPLAYQITCIVGNTLGRTLHGGRSERNEFLLLHAFTQKGYLPPDKRERNKNIALAMNDNEVEGSGKKNKSSYLGGLVLDPKVGFYNRLILLLDFNSLYPSIIQEYNICFTTIDHAHCTNDQDLANIHLPGDSIEQGILPSEIRVLVERRRQVKQLLKNATTPEQKQQYDIRQKALKLTANSMYGCLGFSNSRFYAKPLAAAITGQGREILMHTKELATKLGLDVIYGDTDSIMIDSGTCDIQEAEGVAMKVKQEVNKLYRLLEIDIDGIFKCMLLLKKKKYAAISLVKKGDVWTEHRELKGLDIVRRDWCDLAKNAGTYILDQILAGGDYDQLIGTVQEFLSTLSDNLKNNRIDLADYIITKALTKLPKDYPDKKSLPHVQVAMRMVSRNEYVQPGDVIPYIVCESSEAGLSSAQRAFHPKEVTKQQLKVDMHYYLQSQVHAVVSRLCEPVAGLDSAQLARWLGLDPSLYVKHSQISDTRDGGTDPVPEGVSMENAEPLKVKCPNKECSHVTEISESTPLSCAKCTTHYPIPLLCATLTFALRHYKSKYYKGMLVCEGGHMTRSVSFSHVCRSCGRKVKEMYPGGSLYGQFKFFSMLFKDKEYGILKKMVNDQLNSNYNAYTHISLRHLFPKLR